MFSRQKSHLGWIARGARALLIACTATADATRGPLYRRGAPWRTRLCPIDEPGMPLTMTGTVTVAGECRPIADATLDIWQTNANGWYSNVLGLQNPAGRGTFNLRGRTQSDEQGQYHFESIVPGQYPFIWPLTRPRHIHLIVTHPLCKPLTTQIYFEGDGYNRWDPWWDPSLTIRLTDAVDAPSGRIGRRGVFDIALESAEQTPDAR